MKHKYGLTYCLRRAVELGFKEVQIGASYLVWALNCPTTNRNIEYFVAELIKNQPNLFHRHTRRLYGV